MNRFALLSALAAGCWTSSQTTTTSKVPTDSDVSVVLAAVTLGDDCGDDAAIKPPVNRKPTAGPSVVMPPASAAPCDPRAGSCGRPYRSACEQTSMQLSVRSVGGDSPTTIRVTRVELLDKGGKVLGELESRTPTRWTGDDYIEWNQSIAPNQTLQTSYALSAPDWSTLTGSRWNAHSKTFQLRVTLEVGNKNRTVEKQSITPAMLEPPVPT